MNMLEYATIFHSKLNENQVCSPQLAHNRQKWKMTKYEHLSFTGQCN